MDVKILAAILLTERLVSSTFISLVIYKQIKLFRKPIARVAGESLARAIWARRALFILALLILAGNLVPVAIDIFTLTLDIPAGRTSPSPILAAYGLSNATTSILYSFLIWVIYKLAERISLDQ